MHTSGVELSRTLGSAAVALTVAVTGCAAHPSIRVSIWLEIDRVHTSINGP
jgi:hypothetical protein